MPSQTQAGKAFEYALIIQAYNLLSPITNLSVINNNAYGNAKSCFILYSSFDQSKYLKAAEEAIRHLITLEPRLTNASSANDILRIELMPDNAGKLGDVRDLLFTRNNPNWEMGISAKNNHKAVKHSRLSTNLDFGNVWFGVPCSQKYFNDIAPIFQLLINFNSLNAQWKNVPNKQQKIYVPILIAFMNEVLRLNSTYPDIPAKLVSYLIGIHDFYKVVKRKKVVEVLGFNTNNKLNKAVQNGKSSPISVSKLKLPTQIIQLALKPNSTTTILLVCDQGWQISFRIHSAETLVIPSLKFDINLVGQPQTIYSHHLPF